MKDLTVKVYVYPHAVQSGTLVIPKENLGNIRQYVIDHIDDIFLSAPDLEYEDAPFAVHDAKTGEFITD